jgi:hypothetical protein
VRGEWVGGRNPEASGSLLPPRKSQRTTTTTAGNTYASMKRRSGNIYKRFEHTGTVIIRLGAWWCAGRRS